MMSSIFSKPASKPALKQLPTKRTILSALIVIPYNKTSSKFLKALKADTRIVILKTDKDNVIVILDRKNYQQKYTSSCIHSLMVSCI